MKTSLHFRRYGTGPRRILAFHGYGQQEGHWRGLAAALGPGVSVYAFDLFYHGRSRLARADAPLTKTRLGELLAEFLAAEGIDTFGLLAFSLGARFALVAAEQFGARVEQLWLLAPDGLQPQLWYTLATFAPPARGLLGRAVRRPGRLLSLLGILGRRRLVDPSLLRFAHWHLDSREKRLRVYRTWVGFRHLRVDPARLAARLNQRPTPVVLLLGRTDPVIPPAGLRAFAARLRAATTVVLDAGHAGLIQAVAAYLRQPATRLRW